MKKLLIILSFIILSNNVYADSKFDKDQYNAPKDYSLFSNLSSVKIINLTESGCKGKVTLGGYHGIALTKCYAEHEANDKNIVQYLEELF